MSCLESLAQSLPGDRKRAGRCLSETMIHQLGRLPSLGGAAQLKCNKQPKRDFGIVRFNAVRHGAHTEMGRLLLGCFDGTPCSEKCWASSLPGIGWQRLLDSSDADPDVPRDSTHEAQRDIHH